MCFCAGSAVRLVLHLQASNCIFKQMLNTPEDGVTTSFLVQPLIMGALMCHIKRAELASNKVRESLRDLLRLGDEIAVAVASWSISFDWFTERLVTTESVLTAQVGQPRQSRAFPLAPVGTGLAHASKVVLLGSIPPPGTEIAFAS